MLNARFVKPLDRERLIPLARRCGAVVVVEEHSGRGGFGAAVAEWVIDSAVKPRRFMRIGTPDAFFKRSGEQEYAREQLGLTGHQIAERIAQALA